MRSLTGPFEDHQFVEVLTLICWCPLSSRQLSGSAARLQRERRRQLASRPYRMLWSELYIAPCTIRLVTCKLYTPEVRALVNFARDLPPTDFSKNIIPIEAACASMRCACLGALFCVADFDAERPVFKVDHTTCCGKQSSLSPRASISHSLVTTRCVMHMGQQGLRRANFSRRRRAPPHYAIAGERRCCSQSSHSTCRFTHALLSEKRVTSRLQQTYIAPQ